MVAATVSQAEVRQGAEGKKRPSKPPQRDRLADLANEAEHWHTPTAEAFATIRVGRHKEHWPIRSRPFKDWLTQRYLEKFHGAPSSQAFEDTLRFIEAIARFKSPEHEAHLRVAQSGDALYLDLCDEKWRAVEITGGGWRIVSDPPVRFMRTRGMSALPSPKRGGKIAGLRRFMNVASDDDFKLVVGWLLGAFLSRGPYPILVLNGEQGSAKSTLTRLLRALVDPSDVPIRQVPRNEQDLMIAARNSRVVCLDNVSIIRPWLSDALCRVATGSGYSTRELYTDTDEILFEVKGPVILNGIPDLVERPDFADRAILLSLPRISERKTESEFWADFFRARPRILGAILDAVSCALRRRNDVKLDSLPRMADFALWVTAAEPSLAWPEESFLQAYEANRAAAIEVTLEADPVAGAVIQLVDDKGEWCGTATDLMDKLQTYTADHVLNSHAWPSRPNMLSARLRRAAPSLRAIGVNVNWKRQAKGVRLIEIRRE